MSFSERIGLKQPREVIQLNSMDGVLRMSVYNYLQSSFLGCWYVQRGAGRGVGYYAGLIVWQTFLHQAGDEFCHTYDDFCELLKRIVLKGPWNEVYDLLEFLHTRTPLRLDGEVVNGILENEMSGYRFREGMVVPISDSAELSAIDEALSVGDAFNGARKHIADALNKLSKKPEPDLRNAITEGVAAVESAARVVSGKEKATLADAVKALERAGSVHPALKEAWVRLYGYTSDAEGLRHAMTKDAEIDFATAKYMVVSCAAFVNLLSSLPLPTKQ